MVFVKHVTSEVPRIVSICTKCKEERRKIQTQQKDDVGGEQNKQKPVDIEEPDHKPFNSEIYFVLQVTSFSHWFGDILDLHSCVHRWLYTWPLLLRLLFADPANQRLEREGQSGMSDIGGGRGTKPNKIDKRSPIRGRSGTRFIIHWFEGHIEDIERGN